MSNDTAKEQQVHVVTNVECQVANKHPHPQQLYNNIKPNYHIM